MEFPLRNNERGMVLLIVLLVVALLVTILVEFAFSTLVDLRLAETYRDSTRATYLAKGGIRVGRIILQEDSNGYDSLDETWAQSLENYPVAEGDVSIRIDDQGGRLDLNRLLRLAGNPPNTYYTIDSVVKDRFVLLLETIGAEAPTALADALIDWIDEDDTPEAEGAENYYYGTLMQPYNCKNGFLDSLEELNLVKGYSRELVNKLSRHVTTYGSKKININTASIELLQSLSREMNLAAAEAIIEARRSQPFTSVGQLKERLPELETLYGFIYLYLDVKSSRYQIESTSFVNDGRRTIHVAVAKDGDRILYKRVL